jgi:hypothetical protein
MKIPKEKYWSYLPFQDDRHSFFFPHFTKKHPIFVDENMMKIYFWDEPTESFGFTWVDPDSDFKLETRHKYVIEAIFRAKNANMSKDL